MRQAGKLALLAALSAALLAACSASRASYWSLSDADWIVAASDDRGGFTELGPFSPELLADPVRRGHILRFAYRYPLDPPGDGLIIGIPMSYSYVRVVKDGTELHRAGDPARSALSASRRYLMRRSPARAGELLEIYARLSPHISPARPFVAIGEERFFLERLWAKNLVPLLAACVNALAFAAAAILSLCGSRRPSLRRFLLWGGISLGLALDVLSSSPLVRLYCANSATLDLAGDLDEFALLPLVIWFIADVAPGATKVLRRFARAAILVDLLAAVWAALSPALFAGLLYQQTFILFELLCILVLGAYVATLAPAALFRNGDERLASCALAVFMAGIALALLADLLEPLEFLGRFFPAQTGFALMSLILGSLVFGRYERLRLRAAAREREEGQGAAAPRRAGEGRAAGLDERATERLRQRLEHLLSTERVWSDESITLPKLAAALDAPPHEVSRLINGKYGVNFSTLMNERRLAEAKRLLSSTERTILRIALESGFNSKSAFYRFFRNEVGMTPAQFREQASSSASASAGA